MTQTIERAKYGAAAYKGLTGKLPNPFPREMGPNTERYVLEVIRSGLTADFVTRFEEAFAGAMGSKHCIAAPGCTNAIFILAEAMNFSAGDEIVCSAISDFGNFAGMIKRNYIPVFADVEPGSLNVSARTIERVLSERTRAIVVTHKTGLMCDMDPIMELAGRRGLMVVEDACQAVYSRYKGRLAGTIGHAGAFSFDGEKTMGSDMGGCFITNDDKLAEYARFVGHSRGAEMKSHFGRVHTVAGLALRSPLCTAAVSLAQLEIIERQVAHIDTIIRLLFKLLGEIPGIVPPEIPPWQDVYSAWMGSFCIDPEAFSIDADEFGQQCAAAGLTGAGTARYYNMPPASVCLQRSAAEKDFPFSADDARRFHYDDQTCPNATRFLNTWVRFATICAKWQSSDAELCADIIAGVAERNRR